MLERIAVTKALLHEVALPLREPFVISGGRMAVRRSLIVELRDERGRVGYGESAPFERPFYSGETIASAQACLRDILLPRVLEQTLSGPADGWSLLADGVRENRMAIAGVETALWDLAARVRGAALADIISERLRELGVGDPWIQRRERIECGVALGIPDPEDPARIAEAARLALDRGYRRIKLKIRPGWDVEPIRAAREAIARSGREVPLWADANGSYDLQRDEDALARIDALGLLFVEQPLAPESLWDARELSRHLETPICLDESLLSDEVARQILEMSGPTIWNLKLQRVGGLEEACRIYRRGCVSGVKLWAGTMPETGLGALATLALAAHGGFVYPSDLEPSERWYPPGADIVELQMDSAGTMAVPTEPVALDLALRSRLVATLER